ncbi:MAG: hypothetical protein ACR2IK_19435 [Chloroflexota bacterium]
MASGQDDRSHKSTCHLQTGHDAVQHVVYIQFDNVHFNRDEPNVPSDLEQMPHLLQFMERNGTLLTNHHTQLIAHTATGFLTAFTGVYPDRHGVPISNSFRYFTPSGVSDPASSFAYWTAPLNDTSAPATSPEAPFNMLDANGNNAPAPWVPYTRAGCNFGAVGGANMVLENTSSDIQSVFGANSPEVAEATADARQAQADFVGIAVHCARGSATCATSGARPDLLPQETGGYSGFDALFGHKNVAPQISPAGPVLDLAGQAVGDQDGRPGFPGFDGMTAAVSLAYAADMQEHDIPVTYVYISDAHDAHPPTEATGSLGPGEAGYVDQLQAYDDAFATFFDRLKGHGIDERNTLFVFTTDEGDHFVGSSPKPSGCDGRGTICTYDARGEVNVNLAGLLATQRGIVTDLKIHADSAANIYVDGNPAPEAAVTRALARAAGQLVATNPYTKVTETITQYLADPAEMQLLHMLTADPARTPTLTLFAKPDYFLFLGPKNCTAACVTTPPASTWNHGTVAPDITTIWLGMVGPGVRANGVNSQLWTDHTDIRPTMMSLLGLTDDYRHDGRVLLESLRVRALPGSLRAHRAAVGELGQMYKQINAPVGELGLASLRAATAALESDDDDQYRRLEAALTDITARRDALAGQMLAMLDEAEFHDHDIDPGTSNQLIQQAASILHEVHALEVGANG